MRSRLVGLLVAALAMTGMAVVVTTTAGPAAATAPATAPTNLTVTAVNGTANPELSWSAVPGASGYRVQISTSSTYATVVYDQSTVGLEVTPDQDLPLGTLYWHVAATDGTQSGVGPFANGQPFDQVWAHAPTPVNPLSPTVGGVTQVDDNGNPVPVTLEFPDGTRPAQPYPSAVYQWTPVSGAKSYTLQIDDAPDFVSPQEFSSIVNTSYSLTEPQTVGQTFYWRVRAQSGTSGVVSDWSSPQSYQYDWAGSTPVLNQPDQSSSTDLQFSWQPVPGAKTYQLQISPNADWANNVTLDTEIKSTSYTPTAALLNGSYFWRVRAIDAATQRHYGPWSDGAVESSFQRSWTEAPTLLTPAWDPQDPGTVAQVTGAVDFSWTPVSHAAYYELQVSSNVNFSSTTNCYTNHTEWTSYTRLTNAASEPGSCALATMTWTPGVTYYWRVRGIDAPVGILGVWSSTANGPFRFVRNPTAPTPVSPADDASVTSPVLSWTAVPNVDSYRVTIKNSVNSVVVNAVKTYATTYTPTSGSLSNGPFSWTVQAVDGAGVASALPPQSSWWSFSLDSPSTSTSLSLSSPADGASAVRMPAMSWTAYTSATKYNIHYAINNVEQPTLLATGVTFTSFTYTGTPLPAGQYSWWVEALDAQGHTLAVSDSRTFNVSEAPDDVIPQSAYHTPAGCTGTANVCADTPTLTWDAQPNAAVYVVTIANDPNFTNVIAQYTTAYATLTPRESLLDNQAGQAYYWFVRPCLDVARTNCGPGPESDVALENAARFQKHSVPVNLLSPAASQGAPTPQFTDQVTFSWEDYRTTEKNSSDGAQQEAARYTIQVSTVADFATILDTQTVDGLSYTPSSITYPDGPLYWRVQAIDGSGNALTWSPEQLVDKVGSVPVQQTPSLEVDTTPPLSDSVKVKGTPFLSWTPVPYAAQYTVEVYRNGDDKFSPSNRMLTASTKFVAYSPLIELAPGQYTWRVQAVDASGRPGPWSTDAKPGADSHGYLPYKFTVQPERPDLLAPTTPVQVSAAGFRSLVFAWKPVSHAVQYRWQLSPSQSFSPISASQTTVMTRWAPLVTFADGHYYWRVQALDSSGSVLSSSTNSFELTKDATAPTATAVSPTFALGITSPVTVTFSEPVSGVTTTAFRLVPQGATGSAPGSVTTAGTTATWKPSTALVPGQTYAVDLGTAIVDAFGNPLTPKSFTIRTDTQVDNTSPALVEHWDRDSAKSALGGSYDASKSTGSSASYRFTGTSVSVLGTRMKSGGYAAVYLDGKKQTSTASFYGAKTQYRKVVWSKSGLANSAHTVQVRVLGTKPRAASDHWVYLDGFGVGRTQVDQANAAVTEAFTRTKMSNATGGSYDTASHTTSGDSAGRPSYSVQFRGTGVAAYGVKSRSASKAAVYLDGKLKSTVDLRSTSTYVTTIASFTGLADKVHTLRIDVVGTKTGTGSAVGLDYVRIS